MGGWIDADVAEHGSPGRSPRMSANCWAIFTRKMLSPTSVCLLTPLRTGRSISVGGKVCSVCGKLVYSWIDAILLRWGDPSALLLGIWQSWQDCARTPRPSGSGPSGVVPVR